MRETSVYAAYDAQGDLLYVGASVDVKRRLLQHASQSAWGREVCEVLFRRLPNKKAAIAFETRAIQLLKPKHNKAIRPGAEHKWPVPTSEQIASMVALWHSGQKPSLILPQVQQMMGARVPMHWLRDKIIKATGSARRKPD